MIAYLIKTTPDDNGTLLVTCPAFPEVTTFAGPAPSGPSCSRRHRGSDRSKDQRRRTIAAPSNRGSAEARKRHKGPWVSLPLLTALKAQLYTATQETGVTRAALARGLGWHREQVDRLFRLDHASRLDQIEAAFKQLHRDIDVRVRETSDAA